MKRFHFVHTEPRHPVDRVVELELGIGICGYVTVQLVRADGSIKWESKFKNLITDVGLDMLFGRGGDRAIQALTQPTNVYAGVGTGSTSPTSADTTLDTEITPTTTHRTNSAGGYGSSGPTYVAGSPDYWWRQATFLFDFTQANGNLTEIGIFDANSGGLMFMRQLLKDSGGTPTTIVKTSAEQLRVIYEIRVQPLQSDNVQSGVTISATSYDITTRAANANVAGAWGDFSTYCSFTAGFSRAFALETGTLGARTSIPSGTDVGSITPVVSSYSNGSFTRDIRYEWGPTIANFGSGIGSVVHGLKNTNDKTAQLFQTGFNPAFAKDNTKRLRLDVRYTVDRV